MKSNFFTLLFVLGFTAYSTAVVGQKNFTTTLDALLTSEFMKQFQEIRTSAMASATAFKNQAVPNQQGGYYNPEPQMEPEKNTPKKKLEG